MDPEDLKIVRAAFYRARVDLQGRCSERDIQAAVAQGLTEEGFDYEQLGNLSLNPVNLVKLLDVMAHPRFKTVFDQRQTMLLNL